MAIIYVLCPVSVGRFSTKEEHTIKGYITIDETDGEDYHSYIKQLHAFQKSAKTEK